MPPGFPPHMCMIAVNNEPSITVQQSAGGLCLASGRWTAAYAATLEKPVNLVSSKLTFALSC